jgi:hypothetical protein
MELGDAARDTITGFAGVLVGRAEYLTGCEQFLVEAKSKDGDPPKSSWIDGDRLEVTKAGAAKIAVTAAGGPQQHAPTR